MTASSAIADAILGWVKGSAFPAAPSTNIFLSLHGGEPGPTGVANDITVALAGGRATVPMSSLSGIVDADGGGRETSGGEVITFTGAALAAGTITHVGVWTELTGGTFVAGGLLPFVVPVITGDIVRIPVGRFKLRVPGYQS